MSVTENVTIPNYANITIQVIDALNIIAEKISRSLLVSSNYITAIKKIAEYSDHLSKFFDNIFKLTGCFTAENIKQLMDISKKSDEVLQGIQTIGDVTKKVFEISENMSAVNVNSSIVGLVRGKIRWTIFTMNINRIIKTFSKMKKGKLKDAINNISIVKEIISSAKDLMVITSLFYFDAWAVNKIAGLGGKRSSIKMTEMFKELINGLVETINDIKFKDVIKANLISKFLPGIFKNLNKCINYAAGGSDKLSFGKMLKNQILRFAGIRLFQISLKYMIDIFNYVISNIQILLRGALIIRKTARSIKKAVKELRSFAFNILIFSKIIIKGIDVFKNVILGSIYELYSDINKRKKTFMGGAIALTAISGSLLLSASTLLVFAVYLGPLLLAAAGIWAFKLCINQLLVIIKKVTSKGMPQKITTGVGLISSMVTVIKLCIDQLINISKSATNLLIGIVGIVLFSIAIKLIVKIFTSLGKNKSKLAKGAAVMGTLNLITGDSIKMLSTVAATSINPLLLLGVAAFALAMSVTVAVFYIAGLFYKYILLGAAAVTAVGVAMVALAGGIYLSFLLLAKADVSILIDKMKEVATLGVVLGDPEFLVHMVVSVIAIAFGIVVFGLLAIMGVMIMIATLTVWIANKLNFEKQMTTMLSGLNGVLNKIWDIFKTHHVKFILYMMAMGGIMILSIEIAATAVVLAIASLAVKGVNMINIRDFFGKRGKKEDGSDSTGLCAVLYAMDGAWKLYGDLFVSVVKNFWYGSFTDFLHNMRDMGIALAEVAGAMKIVTTLNIPDKTKMRSTIEAIITVPLEAMSEIASGPYAELFDTGMVAGARNMFKSAMYDLTGGLLGKKQTKISNVLRVAAQLGGAMCSLAKGVHDMANLTFTEYDKNGKAKEPVKLGETDFAMAGTNIGKVITRSLTDISTLASNPDIAATVKHHGIVGWFTDNSDVGNVLAAAMSVSNFMSNLASSIVTFASGKYQDPESQEWLKIDFTVVGANAAKAIESLMSGVASIKAPEDWEDNTEYLRSITDPMAGLVSAISGITEKHSKYLSDTAKSVDGLVTSVNRVDLSKIEKMNVLVSKLQEFSQGINYNFKELANVINGKLVEAMENLKEVLEETNKVFKDQETPTTTPPNTTMEGNPAPKENTTENKPAEVSTQLQQLVTDINDTIKSIRDMGVNVKVTNVSDFEFD